MVRIPLPPPRIKILILLVFFTFNPPEFSRYFRAFARCREREVSCRDDFIRQLEPPRRVRLDSAFWWCGGLLRVAPIPGERGGRAAETPRDRAYER